MFQSKPRDFIIIFLVIKLSIPLIIGNPDTYFFLQQHLLALEEHVTTISALSRLECASICKKYEICSIANYGHLNSMCELINAGRIASEIARVTERWQILCKTIQIRSINNLKLMISLYMYISLLWKHIRISLSLIYIIIRHILCYIHKMKLNSFSNYVKNESKLELFNGLPWCLL